MAVSWLSPIPLAEKALSGIVWASPSSSARLTSAPAICTVASVAVGAEHGRGLFEQRRGLADAG